MAITTDPTVVTKLSLEVGVGAEANTDDKTRPLSHERGGKADAEKARLQLWELPPERQFTPNETHVGTILGNLFGAGAKWLGGKIGGDMGDLVAQGGEAIGHAGGHLVSILGDLI
jgi:hypothetical protein